MIVNKYIGTGHNRDLVYPTFSSYFLRNIVCYLYTRKHVRSHANEKDSAAIILL